MIPCAREKLVLFLSRRMKVGRQLVFIEGKFGAAVW
jgi:hypothetical protein